MVIDKIGVNAPVERYGLDENLAPVVPTGGNAASVVAWYDFSVQPGAAGNSVYGGHVTWFGSAVFYNLTALTAGDTVRLVGQNGAQVTYTVTDAYSVSAYDPNAVEVMWPTTESVITLITCTGGFTSTGDDVFGGEYSERFIVRGALTSVTPGAAVASGG